MPGELTRILSDLHYGDSASRVRRLAQVRPLFDGASEVILNGDTLDTRPGTRPQFDAEIRAEVAAFSNAQACPVTLHTGNHDPDISPHHSRDLADGKIFVTHGDILLDNIVPWGRDAKLIGPRIAAELAKLPPHERDHFESRIAVWRRVAATIRQRHQSEPRGWRYAAGFIADTMWPPLRVLRVLETWSKEAARGAALVRRHRPQAKFLVVGHTHRPAVRPTAQGVTVINTGAFCPPFGSYAVDVAPSRLVVRSIASRGGEFRLGASVAEFPLARD